MSIAVIVKRRFYMIFRYFAMEDYVKKVTFHTIKIRSNIKHQIISRQSNTRAFSHQILSASPCSSVSSSGPRFSSTAADNVDFAQIVLR